MSSYSVSYNFPNDFLWGITMPSDFATGKADNSVLFQIKEKSIQGVCLSLEWADFEPLKNNYDENLIDSVRLTLSRIRSLNMEAIVLLNISAIPQWQNLEHDTKKDFFSSEKYNFAAYLVNALIPYTNFFGLYLSDTAFYSNKEINTELEVHSSIRDYVLSLKSSAMVGTILSPRIFEKKRMGFRAIFQSANYGLLKKFSSDFIGISADTSVYDTIQNIFRDDRKPLFVLNDQLNRLPMHESLEKITDNLFEIWRFYQKGWQILGYFSVLDVNQNEQAFDFFSKACKTNALELSSDDVNLSEKWLHFLKD